MLEMKRRERVLIRSHFRESRSLMLFWWIVVLLEVLLVSGVFSGMLNTTATRRPEMDDTVFEVYFLWNRTVRATPLCVAECDKDVRCASVTYTNINNECQGHSLTFGLKGQHAVNMAGTRYFVLPHGQSYIGDACAVNSDCVTLNAECRYGQCLCVPGYSFSPAERQCTHGCTVYGEYFTPVHDYFISGTNMDSFTSVSLDGCLFLCANRTGYTCVSVEYIGTDQKCNTQTVSSLDVPSLWRYDSIQQFNVSYYQRDCF